MNASPKDTTALPYSPAEQDVHRQLIEQFYKNSIERYGIDSDQTRIIAQHLSAYTGQSE